MDLPPQARLLGYSTAYFASQTVFAAAELGLADALAAGSVDAAAAAARVGADEPAVYRLLRALVGLGLATEDGERRFTLTEMGQLLRSDVPGSMRDFVRMQREHYAPWARLTDSVRAGKVGFELQYGKPIFEWLAEHPESARVFDGAMAAATSLLGRLVAASHDFSRFPVVVDVGGGTGLLLAEILSAHPGVRGILADLGHVLGRAPAHPRMTPMETDFFAAVPRGGDLYVMKSVLHDWNDEQAIAILKNVRQAGSRLLLVEWVLPEAGQPLDARGPLFDLNMMVMTGGRERTGSEWRQLLLRGGFDLVKSTLLPTGISLIEGVGIA